MRRSGGGAQGAVPPPAGVGLRPDDAIEQVKGRCGLRRRADPPAQDAAGSDRERNQIGRLETDHCLRDFRARRRRERKRKPGGLRRRVAAQAGGALRIDRLRIAARRVVGPALACVSPAASVRRGRQSCRGVKLAGGSRGIRAPATRRTGAAGIRQQGEDHRKEEDETAQHSTWVRRGRSLIQPGRPARSRPQRPMLSPNAL